MGYVGCVLAERGGFEPPVQVNPAQQVSNLARSATPAPLRGCVVASGDALLAYHSVIGPGDNRRLPCVEG
jgi:hypothetical protein